MLDTTNSSKMQEVKRLERPGGRAISVGAACTRAGLDGKRFAVITFSVLMDPRLGAEALVYLAHRATYAGRYSHADSTFDVHPIVKGAGFGRDVRERARRELVKAGYLKRSQISGRSRGRFTYAQETLTLPEAALRKGSGIMVRQCWFDGQLTVKEMAAYILLRALTMNHARVYTRELQERFVWARPTAAKVLARLIELGLVTETSRRDRGRFNGTVYRANEGFLWKATAVKKPGHGLPGHGLPGRDYSGHTLTFGESLNAPSEDSPFHAPLTEEYPNTHAARGHYASSASPIDATDMVIQQALDLLGELPEELSSNGEEVYDCVHDLPAFCEAAPDEILIPAIHQATGGKVAREILTPAGAMAVRLLAAAYAFGYDDPVSKLNWLLGELNVRIGARKGARLSSLMLIYARAAGNAASQNDHLYGPSRTEVV